MSDVRVRCKNCERMLYSYRHGEEKKRYGTPINKCKKCGEYYVDIRYREAAVDGIPENELSYRSGIIFLVIGALIMWRAIYLYNENSIVDVDNIKWMIYACAFAIFAIVLIGIGLYDIVNIVTGNKKKKIDNYIKESEERMKSHSYVEILKHMGYRIPEKYEIGDNYYEKRS